MTAIAIRSREAWDHLWLQTIAYNWRDDCKINSTNDLYKAFERLNVWNIEKTTDCGKDIIKFLAFKNDETSTFLSVSYKESSASFDVYTAFAGINSWRGLTGELTIKIPPHDTKTEDQPQVLADYITLGLYFPFGMEFNSPYDSDRHTEGSESTKGITLSKAINLSPARSEGHQLSQEGDRGGAQGLDDDYKWLQFVPRLTAYNWSLEDDDRIKHDTNLADCTNLLRNTRYEIPKGLTIKLKEADKPPRNEDGSWNMDAYASNIGLEVQASPRRKEFRAIALADLNATRANEPFTCS